MRLKQAINEKIHMYDQCIMALGHAVDDAVSTEWTEGMIDFLVEERQRLRTEAKELDDGTHWIFADSPPWVNGDNVSTG